MTALTLLAVTAETDAVAASAALERSDAHIAVARGLAALALPTAKGGFWRTRKAIGKALVETQAALEAAHAVAPLLPAAPGADLADFGALQGFLAANASMLSEGLSEYGDLEQHQLLIKAPVKAMLQRLSRYPAWGAARAAASDGDRAGAGRILQEASEAERARLAARYALDLAPAAVDLARLPEGDDETILNVVALTGRGGDAALEAALEGFDAEWEGALAIRMIGPAPASSFASIAFDRPDPAAVSAAEQTLGVRASEGVDAVRAAYRAAVKRAHPDVAGAASAALTRTLGEAQTLLRRVAEARQALVSAGASADAPPILAVLRREGDAAKSDADQPIAGAA
ncbi:MAG: GvpL/GvpF family gas vesicle protein [Pseudomonadota bacterium]